MGVQQRSRQMAANHMCLMQFWGFVKVFKSPTQSQQPIILKKNKKTKRVIQTLEGCIRKLKFSSRDLWGRVLQLAASSYWMVPHGSTGMTLFLILYGREALMPEEILHVTYASNYIYEVAVEKHIIKMLAIHQEAIKKNQVSIQRSKESLLESLLKRRSHTILLLVTLFWWISKRE